jgi:hypothetical protein
LASPSVTSALKDPSSCVAALTIATSRGLLGLTV